MRCCDNCGCEIGVGCFKCANCTTETKITTIKKVVKKTKKFTKRKRVIKHFNFIGYMARQIMFGDKQKNIKEFSKIKLVTLEKQYSNLNSFLTKDANNMREEINRLRIVVG